MLIVGTTLSTGGNTILSSWLAHTCGHRNYSQYFSSLTVTIIKNIMLKCHEDIAANIRVSIYLAWPPETAGPNSAR